MSVRLAVVQHGDYADALRQARSGEPEDYFGLVYSVEATERLLDDREFLLVSLDAPPYRVPHRNGTLVGMSPPRWPKLGKAALTWAAYREVRRFRPTHLLLRSTGLIASPLLRSTNPRGVSTLILGAGYMRSASWRERALNRDLARLMNDPAVFLVGNHRVPAAESMVANGVRREKVVAYDWPGQPRPEGRPPKAAPRPGQCRLAYVGSIAPGKGTSDLLDAVIGLNRSGFPASLTACGDGQDLEALRRKAAAELGDRARFVGRLANREALGVMAEADLVVVAPRRESSEGLPFVATEALACRTPLIASDHPTLTHLLRDGEGVRFFASGDPTSLASVVREVMSDPEGYVRLSEGTAEAYARLECRTAFHELIDRWVASW